MGRPTYDTICYLGLSAHDFTEISAARKELAPDAELRFFTAAVELLDHVNYSHATRILVFLDTRVLDPEWELVRRLKSHDATENVRVVLLSMALEASEVEKARSCGIGSLTISPVQPESLHAFFLKT